MSIRSHSRLRRLLAAAIALVLPATLVSSVERSGTRDAGPRQAAPPVIGELPERRTPTSATRRNRDGSLTTTLFGAPVHYRAADGSWQPIEVGLRRVDEDGYAWRSGANAYQARFRIAAQPELMEFRLGERIMRITAEGTAPRPARPAGASRCTSTRRSRCSPRRWTAPSGSSPAKRCSRTAACRSARTPPTPPGR